MKNLFIILKNATVIIPLITGVIRTIRETIHCNKFDRLGGQTS